MSFSHLVGEISGDKVMFEVSPDEEGRSCVGYYSYDRWHDSSVEMSEGRGCEGWDRRWRGVDEVRVEGERWFEVDLADRAEERGAF